MMKIALLKNHPQHITALAQIWYEVLGKIWVTDVSIEQVIQHYSENLNDNELPITFIALDKDKAVAMATLRVYDGVRPDLKPWLGSLVVDPAYQRQGIAPLLIDAIKQKAVDLGFEKMHLFALDPTIPEYYKRLGWEEMDIDEYKNNRVVVMKYIL